MKYLSLLCLLLCHTLLMAQLPEGSYKVYDSKLKKEVTIDDITNAVTAKQVLIFGEQHDDSTGHVLEKAIFQKLHGRFGQGLVLTLEMFERDAQQVLDEYLAGIISEKNFKKEARAWNNYEDYKPLVEFAKANKLSVVAANAPARYTNLVTRKGLGALDILSKEVKKKYIAPLPVDTLSGIYYEKFLEAMGGHTTPGMNLYQSQNFWDATMSYSIDQAMKEQKSATVLQVNGRFHSDNHSGLGERLRLNYKRAVTTISCFSAEDFSSPDWNQYAPLADYIILTKPAVKEQQ